MSHVTVIIPAYNPIKLFVELVQSLVPEFDVLVVNDGSKSECKPMFDEVRALGATIIEHSENRGKGAALKTAIAHLQSTGKQWVAVTADADGQHSVKDIREVARLTVQSPESLVLGVRSFKGMPPRSYVGNMMTRVAFALATHRRISDTQTGLRGFSYLTGDKLITAEGDRYEYEMNVLINSKKWGIPVIETTIETIYIDGNASSHFHPFRDSMVVLAQILKHTAASLVCTALDFALYYLLWLVLKLSPTWSYLVARAASASVNYQLSRRVVFHAKASWRTTLSYYLLAVCTASTGTVLVGLITRWWPGSAAWIKVPIDVTLFFVNYFAQKNLVFFDKKA